MFCTDCGAATASDAKFCIQCGAKVGERVEDSERKIIAISEPLAPRQQSKEIPIEATESTIYKGRTLFRVSSGKWSVAGIQNSAYEKLNEAMLFVDTVPISTPKLAPSAAPASQADAVTVYKGHTLVKIGEKNWKISGFDSAVYLDISAAMQRIDVLEKATGETVKEGVVDRVQETAQNTESKIFLDEESEAIDKWTQVQVISTVFLFLSISIAWVNSAWIIGIAGIVICSGILIYSGTEKEQAKQRKEKSKNDHFNRVAEETKSREEKAKLDEMDHRNRAAGMSESLVQATRDKRAIENVISAKIIELATDSLKLVTAHTYAEKNAAEAKIVQTKAFIELGKLHLQRAVDRVNSETKSSQQQLQTAVSKTNNSSEAVSDSGFIGEKNLANDGYKIYLVKKYKIERNDALGKIICGDRLFGSIDEALAFSDLQEAPKKWKD